MASERQRIAFTLELGRTLHRFGASAFRLEEVLASVSRSLGLINAQFFSTPTSLFASFGELGAQQTSLQRIEPGAIDLGKLADVDRLAEEVAHGLMDVEVGTARLHALTERPHRIGPLLTVLAYAMTSACSARFFGGGIREVLVGCGIGFVSGALSLVLVRSISGARVYDMIAAALASLIAQLSYHSFGGISVYICTLSGLIVLVPGLTLTTSISELATRHLASGTARLMAAATSFLLIGFGVAMGDRIGRALLGIPLDVPPVALPSWTELVALVITSACLVALFRAHFSAAPAILTACSIAYFGSRQISIQFGPELGVFCGAFAAAITANVYTRRFNRPAVVPLVPAILLLVPGSVGFRSVSSFLAQNMLSGIEAGFRMVMIAVAIVAGLLFANVTVSPKRAL
jgi:uncharacterized membrane protein YjjP (DUF1212 family)